MENSIKIDQAVEVSKGESLDIDQLNELIGKKGVVEEIISVKQFPGGYSNLTYLLEGNKKHYVLRKAPKGAKDIKGGHNLEREFNILYALKEANFNKIPKPLQLFEAQSEDELPFYIMEKVDGVILRANDAKMLKSNFSETQIRQLSENLCKTLVELHGIDINQTKLKDIGKPEGYIKRQVEGWWKRYENSKTDEISEMEFVAKWLIQNLPEENPATLIHNDFKYDNVVLNPKNPTEIIAILDWEMCTIGDPMMDLGTTLSYWTTYEDDDFLKSFNLSWLRGNLTKKQFAELYAELSGRDVSNIIYYYVFGLFKNAVVIQQIYARFKKGLSKDTRFTNLNLGVSLLAKKAKKTIDTKIMA